MSKTEYMMKIFKRKEVFTYDRKVGMTVWRALPIWSLAIAIFVSFGIKPNCVNDQIKMSLIITNIVYLVFDTTIRIIHYLERKANEQIAYETDDNRFVSKKEKSTFWLIRVCTPLYLFTMSITAILLNI